MSGVQPTALITGVTGQDGSYLSELLCGRGWNVFGTVRPGEEVLVSPILETTVQYIEQDLADSEGLVRIVGQVAPDYVFHLGGISSVWQSWQDPVAVTTVNAVSGVALLESSLRLQELLNRPVKFINASSAEIFGLATESPQTEETTLAPVSPYGASKALVHSMVRSYRKKGLAASNAILYNHESPRRPMSFVTRKITSSVARISLGMSDSLELGNIDARRDWGWAPDYVDCLERIALAPSPGDYVISTGVAHSVEEFVAAAFAVVGIDDWKQHVVTADRLQRPTDAVEMTGNPQKAMDLLGWKSTVRFDEIVRAMVNYDIELLDQGSQPI